jgi:hypothetical protein
LLDRLRILDDCGIHGGDSWSVAHHSRRSQ